jgi:hypothetical protein
MNNIKSVCSPLNIASIGVEIAASGLIGYGSAALFTTINPVFGAIHGLTYSVTATITKVCLMCFAKKMNVEIQKTISQAVGFGVATAVSMCVLGLSPLAVLALGISQVAFTILFTLGIIGAGLVCVSCCPKVSDLIYGISKNDKEDSNSEDSIEDEIPLEVNVILPETQTQPLAV